IDRDWSHPCIIAWVPFNESWGVPNLPDSQPERHYVQALYHLTKTLDPTRPVVGNDGWESVATDFIGIHDYDANIDRIARRYRARHPRPARDHRPPPPPLPRGRRAPAPVSARASRRSRADARRSAAGGASDRAVRVRRDCARAERSRHLGVLARFIAGAAC